MNRVIFFILFSLLFFHCNQNCPEGTFRCADHYKQVCLCSYDYESCDENDIMSDCEDCSWYTEEDCRDSNKTCVESNNGASCQ
jgi:hypothetical protein